MLSMYGSRAAGFAGLVLVFLFTGNERGQVWARPAAPEGGSSYGAAGAPPPAPSPQTHGTDDGASQDVPPGSSQPESPVPVPQEEHPDTTVRHNLTLF